MKSIGRCSVYGSLRAPLVILACAALAGWAAPAKAYEFNTSPDWDVELNTNVAYALGFRADKMNDKYGNNPAIQESEYKFPDRGSIVSNRVDISSEFSAIYQEDYGVDVSYSGWKDFAYGDNVKNNPGEFGGVPYSTYAANPSGHYGAYTNHLYNLGGELGNAFVIANISPDNIPISIKAGRFTEYWGNAIFSGYQAISYSQSPIDVIKAVDSPGTQVKDLFEPKTQVSVHAEVSPELALGAYYQFEWRPERYPEGGTSLGIEDPLFSGSTNFSTTPFVRGGDHTPPAVDGNLGVEALWSPDFLNGTIGFYYRQFDDAQSYSVASLGYTNGAPTNYYLNYARRVKLYGVSLDRNIGPLSADIEASIRTNTGLHTAALVNGPNQDGARGTLLNVVANSIYALTPNALWQTGALIGEVAFTHVYAVTHDKDLYDGVGYAQCEPNKTGVGWRTGCSTTNTVVVNVLFDPQWLSVFPSVDIDLPLSLDWGAIGNGPTQESNGTGDVQDSFVYSAGIHALYRQKYNIKLSYDGYQSPVSKSAPAYPGGPNIYSSGDGEWMWNDRAQVFLTLSTQF